MPLRESVDRIYVVSSPNRHHKTINGVDICYFQWNGAASCNVLLVHATGFHARCWNATVEELGSEYRITAIDMRGHGRSERKNPYDWPTFGKDLAQFVEVLDLRDTIGVGHSMGGHSLVQACAAHPDRFKGLVLVDPVIFPSDSYTTPPKAQHNSVDLHPISRRRNEWKSPQEMVASFEFRHPFNLWRKECLCDYCFWGLISAAEGQYELACPPRVEASIYMGSRSMDISHLCETIQQPVVVMRAQVRDPDSQELDFSKSPTRSDLHLLFANGDDRFLPHLSHFIPMQSPDLVAHEITRLAQLR